MAFLALLLLCAAIAGAVVETTSHNYRQYDSDEVAFLNENHHHKDAYTSYIQSVPDVGYQHSRIPEHLKVLSDETEKSAKASAGTAIKFSDKRGRLATLAEDRRSASRDNSSSGNALVYTTRPLEDDELFEIKISEMDGSTNGNWMFFGVTVKNPSDYDEIPDSIANIMAPSWLLFMTSLFENNGTLLYLANSNYCPQISQKGDRLGVLKKSNGDIHFYYNGDDLGVAASGVEDEVYAAIDINTSCKTVEIY